MDSMIGLYKDKLSELNKNISLSEKIYFLHSVVNDRLGCVDRIAVIVYDPKTDFLKTFIHSSAEDHPLVRYQAKLTEAKSLMAIVQTGQARVVNDLTVFKGGKHEHTKRIAAQGFGSSYTLPIYHNRFFLGFVFLNSYQRDSFRSEILHDLDLFGHLISSLVAGELATIRMMLAAVRAAEHITSYRDTETGAHIERVSHYARFIAQELAPKYGFNDEFIEHLFLFSSLHDIGKIGLSDAILKKAGKLTQEEFDEMKEHVIMGRQIIDGILRDFGLETFEGIEMIRNIAEYHHEAVDGSGYCKGLQKEEIPIEARIVSVADIFDALTSRRRYKAAWSNDEAFALLQRLAGSKLDKESVAALLENRESVEKLQNRFKEAPAEEQNQG
jgi:HD-GYP domain-containing protein (c-di-GMP phosphodiesterase class II)